MRPNEGAPISWRRPARQTGGGAGKALGRIVAAVAVAGGALAAKDYVDQHGPSNVVAQQESGQSLQAQNSEFLSLQEGLISERLTDE